MQNIRDQLSFEINVLPDNITEAYELLSSYTKNKHKSNTTEGGKRGKSKNKNKDDNDKDNVGMSYLQEDDMAGKDV